MNDETTINWQGVGDDTEAHGFRRNVDRTGDDTEGHGRHLPPAPTDGEDTDGHRFKGAVSEQPDDDGEDTEGHAIKGHA